MFDEIIKIQVGTAKLSIIQQYKESFEKVSKWEKDPANNTEPSSKEKEQAELWSMMALAGAMGVVLSRH